MLTSIKKILIANRSEIAMRIIQTCKSFGIQTVAVYAPEDATAPYVYAADQAVALEVSGSAGYLDANLLVTIALKNNCDAVHPGYGFLSEKESFASAVIKAGLLWIGPHPRAIEQAGNKSEAHAFAQALQIPVIQGASFRGNQQEQAYTYATQIGFPIMLKSALGGGGKAMRIVHAAESFYELFDIVTRESLRFFHGDQILLEKYIAQARHIEIQIAGDGTNVIHLFERECSLQRRNQKIIEEAPSLFVSQKTLDQLYAASIKLGTALQYNNVGTVEFLVTPEEDFYFLEINTRLQVEHAVTEFITGIDLVWLQIYVAEFKKLPFQQEQITQRGHAIQARIYAEDCQQQFMPSSGTLAVVAFANHPFARIDHALTPHTEITSLFDPMIAKVIGWGASREFARKNLITVLEQTVLHGIENNLLFLTTLLYSDAFIQGNIFTALLSNYEFLQELVVSMKEYTFEHQQEFEQLGQALIQEFEARDLKIPQTTLQNSWKLQLWK